MDNYLRAIDRKISVFGELMLRNSNIVAVGRGNKRINGAMIKNRPTLTIFVKKKLLNSAIESEQRIPKTIGGIETDVYEIDSNKDSKLVKVSAGNLITDLKPAFGSGSLGVPRNGKTYIATLTYGCTNKREKDKLYALTSAHTFIMGINPVNPGQAVYYFRGNDKKAFEKNWKIGTFFQAKTKMYEENDIDAALIYIAKNDSEGRKIIAPGLVNSKIITNTYAVEHKDVDNEEKVYKIGMMTGYTEGKIIAINTTMKVDGGKGTGIISYKNQICTDIDVAEGDSGALGIMKKTQEAFGMQNTGGGMVSTFSEIGAVLKAFDIELLI